MKPLVAALAAGVLSVGVAAQRGNTTLNPMPVRPPLQQPPQFRATVELVHLDVSVLDNNRRPIKGLGPADFTILENGTPQDVAVFTAVDIPDPEPPRAAWIREVAPDVRSNQDVRERRLFLLLIDDATIDADPRALNNVRTIARGMIDRLGDSDLAAVVFARDNRNSQDFTADRARLLAAVNTFQAGFRGMGPMDDLYFRYSVGVMKSAVEVFSKLPDRRKAVIYIGQGAPVDLSVAGSIAAIGLNQDGSPSAASVAGEMGMLARMMSQAFEAAARANVNVYTLDACGLRVPPAPPPPAPRCVPGLEVDYLNNLASATGARAVVNTNDFNPGMNAIFVENSSYYLLGYQSTDSRQDGKLRRIDVRVNRPGVTVRTRNGYLAEKAESADKRKKELEAQPLGAALAGVLPKGDLPMQLTAVPFAIPGKKESAVAVILGVKQPIRESNARTIEKVDLFVGAYNTDGKAFGSTRLRADVTVRANASGLAEYEVLARIDLKPGRYQLRIAANVGSLATSGSLYYDVDVPDFMDAPLSLSGMIASATPAPILAPRDGLKGVIAVLPTTKRVFRTTDQASAFLRVYQGGKSPLGPAELRVQLKNDEDLLVIDRREVIQPSAFANARAADVNIALPLGRLGHGAYVLTVSAESRTGPIRRHLRFWIE